MSSQTNVATAPAKVADETPIIPDLFLPADPIVSFLFHEVHKETNLKKAAEVKNNSKCATSQ